MAEFGEAVNGAAQGFGTSRFMSDVGSGMSSAVRTASRGMQSALKGASYAVKKLKFEYVLIAMLMGLLLLSVFSRFKESFEDIRRVDSYLPNYVVEVQRRCRIGEHDEGRYCVKEGCPKGMERGSGSGSHLCYPKCLDGYDSNGMSRCYKKCPVGFTQDKTTCTNPGHKFRKDQVPCKGCLGPPPVVDDEGALQAHLPYMIEPPNAPVIMTPASEAYPATVISQPPIDGWFSAIVQEPPVIAKLFPTNAMEYFDGEAAAKQDPVAKVTVNLKEPRIDDPELPCPRGYTLSGDMCNENCPPYYRDTMDGYCVKPGYTIDRDSYDRGPGVPYITKRLKYEHIYHT
jgi:hypothetical protein